MTHESPESGRAAAPKRFEWLVYAPAEVVASQLTNALGASGLSGSITPDLYREHQPIWRAAADRESSGPPIPLGTFSGWVTTTIEGHAVRLGFLRVSNLPNERSTVAGAPSLESGDKPWSDQELHAWDRIQQTARDRFARVGVESDDMLAAGFVGPRPAGETRVAISKPSERSMWVDPVFYSRAFQRRDELCFVVMPFREELLGFYNSAVKPVVEELGLNCQLANDISAGHGDVVDEIWVALNEARLLIADLTGQNANVFYELGIANTLGKHVVAICKRVPDEQQGKLPFDVSGRRTIFYQDTAVGAETFKQDLRRHIKTILESRA